MPPYSNRFAFLYCELFVKPKTYGQDLPEEHRECGICLETIEDASLAVRNCPTAPRQHNFHLLCQVKWLSYWPRGSDGPNRTCPTCSTELYRKDDFPVERAPSEETARRLADIDNAWEELLTAATERFPPTPEDKGYIDEQAALRTNENIYRDSGDFTVFFEGLLLITVLVYPDRIETRRAVAYLRDDGNEEFPFPKGNAYLESIRDLDSHLAWVNDLQRGLGLTF
ncbi:PA and RING finger domain protein [Lasiodiplodia theobromae]|uniref:PA and RING finger domain protein n=1 Tax=Lasiodiplodia theobromae TaxID=45133 RepID=UPI0015C3AACE|nr:PA and RING finger domain protein [Lasiodiplodia theobromae]KAF4536865.1 PA and RING finger domain protein [Lasiodiplodia theobromae]